MIKHIDWLIPEIDQWITPWRLKWYPRVVLIALSVGFIFGVLYGKGVNTVTGRLGADYPAFYGAGRIIAQGDWNELYDAKRQLLVQEDLISGDSGYLCFAYPPHVALVYWPFSLLNYRLSYTLHTLLMVGALLLTLHLIRPMINQVNQYYLCAFTLILFFYPILRSVLGGQNTAILPALSWDYSYTNRSSPCHLLESSCFQVAIELDLAAHLLLRLFMVSAFGCKVLIG